MEALFGVVLLVLVFALASALIREVRAHHQLRESIPEIERRARDHAVKTSDGVRLGQLAEQFVPFLPQFQYNPQDAHFLGKPIDFIVFDGLCDDGIDQIVFIEVKSGKKKTLDRRQRHVRDCILAGRIKFEVVPVSEVASTYS